MTTGNYEAGMYSRVVSQTQPLLDRSTALNLGNGWHGMCRETGVRARRPVTPHLDPIPLQTAVVLCVFSYFAVSSWSILILPICMSLRRWFVDLTVITAHTIPSSGPQLLLPGSEATQPQLTFTLQVCQLLEPESCLTSRPFCILNQVLV